MTDLSMLLELIKQYYPRNISFDTNDYKNSIEYNSILKKRREYQENNFLGIHFNKILRDIFNDYEVIDWTDLCSSNCYEYRILLHKNQLILDDDIDLMKALNGNRVDLCIFISILDKYYFYYINETKLNFDTNEWVFKKSYNILECKEIVNKLKVALNSEGYHELNYEIVNTIVENVETEFIEKGNVKVFNCIFSDLITMK